MSLRDDPPLTLAELRRNYVAKARPRTRVPEVERSLFDTAPFPLAQDQPESPKLGKADVAPSPAAAEASPLPETKASLLPAAGHVLAPWTEPRTRTVPHPPARHQETTAPQLPSPPQPSVWTVTALVQRVRSMMEGSYRTIWVEGEISNWRPAGSGHCYFTLKDGNAQLSAVLFRKQAALLRFRPKDGDTVRLRGQLSVYESRGQMQLIGEALEQLGLGALLAATRELKERLRNEGLFERKRPLPAFPRCIGVITSLRGAALRDIIKVCKRRHAAVNLLIYPVAVQGASCVLQVEAALRWFGAHAERVDVVLVARGGGSWEDLHGFDHERIARAIVACSLPVISGIGHATDTTIADAAADVCAPTPSAAAELLTAAQHRVEDQLTRLSMRLHRAGRFELLRARQRLQSAGVERLARRAEAGLERRFQRLDELTLRLREAAGQRRDSCGSRLWRADARLRQVSPAQRLSALQLKAAKGEAELHRLTHRLLDLRRNRWEHARARLEALSPLRVLERGYALVYDPAGQLLRSPAEVDPGEQLRVRLAKGTLRARVEPEV